MRDQKATSDNNQRWGFSVRIFVPSGEPEGLRVIEKSNWTGQGLVFPRSLFPEVRAREELGRTGIYVLWEVGTTGQLPRVYVGEDTADAESYLADVLLCLPLMGVSFFEKPKSPTRSTRDLFLNAKGIRARAFEHVAGFVVRADSQAVKNEVSSIHGYLSELRSVLLNQGILKDAGANYRLAQDYTFPSPSTASGVLLGRSSNGRKEWKDTNGRSLKDIQDAQVDDA
jgi:hypothetical protein